MPINVSTNGIGKIMLGSSTEIIRVYLGTTIVYESQKPNIFKFEVSANQTITLQNDTRGAKAVTTDWGDGTRNTSLTHTYTSAGTYSVSTAYSVVASTATVEQYFYDLQETRLAPKYDDATTKALVEVVQVCDKITNINYMFYECRRLPMNKINLNNINPANFNSAIETFWLTGYNTPY